MEKISNTVLYVVFAIILFVGIWIAARKGYKNGSKETIQRRIAKEPIEVKQKETDRPAVKHDFNDLDSLINDVKDTKEEKEPLK